MNYELIKIEEKFSGQVAKISLNAPSANILSCKMMEEISRALGEIEKKRQTKLVIITGAGAHFSFGASVEEHLPGKVDGMLPQFHRFIGEVLNFPVPTVAQISGMCLGGGFELAIACSLIFADETAKCGVPEIHLGVFPPVAAALLPILSRGAAATQMLLTGDRFGAHDLDKFGLLNKVVATGTLETELSAFIEKQILPKSASSLRIAHRAARLTVCEHYAAQIGKLEKMYLKELMQTEDAKEGITAFVEKRPAKWKDM